ncbi:MAG: hypothetical protein WCV64_06900 [Desulfurivibrionaceae bacterium]
MPELTAIGDARRATACESIFPRGHWQFAHAIDFSMQDGSGGTVIGVTSLSEDEIACALMTIEGLTLFEAVSKKGEGLEVRRAVAPFNKPAFAEGLMADVRAIFLPPAAINIRHGWLDNNVPVCRYTGIDGRTTDILPATDDCWQIKTYTSELVMDRSIVGYSCQKKENSLIPEHLELKGFTNSGYTLKMTLIHAENLTRKTLP